MSKDAQAFDDLVEEEQIESIMQPDGPTVVIDFWSPSCGPCMAMADDFAAVAAQFDPDEVRFCKVDTSEHGYLAAPFKIRSVPTILFIHKGAIKDAVVGRMSAKQLGERAEWLLKKSQSKGLLGKLFG